MYDVEIEETALKTFKKLLKKDRKQWEEVKKKIEQIQADPYQFKPLKDRCKDDAECMSVRLC